MPEVDKTVVAWFRQAERHYSWILERFILQKLRVKVQSGFRVNFNCYQRSLESVNNFIQVLTLSPKKTYLGGGGRSA